MSKEAMKLALEALIAATPVKAKDPQLQACAILALREALAEQPAPVQQYWEEQPDGSVIPVDPSEMQPAQQEPVAWWDKKLGVFDEKHFDHLQPLYTSPPAQRKPLTDEMVVAAARMLSDRQAAACNVDCGDMWKLHGNDFIDDARAALEAAHGIKENT